MRATRHWGNAEHRAGPRAAALALLGALLIVAPASAQHDAELPEPAWRAELGDTPVHRGGRERTAAQVHDTLSPSQQRALSAWIAFAQRHELHVVVPAHADAMLFGTCDVDMLEDAADTFDETWELFDALQPVAAADEDDDDPRDDDAVTPVFFLFDAEGHAGPAWSALLDELAVRGQLVSEAVSALRHEPNSLTQRQERLVLQTTYDLAGDASQGDDEFRLQNELAHKLTWMLLLERFGRLPPVMEWGLGYVAEQRLFRSIYLFDHAGFVAASDHEDWPKKTRDMLRDDRDDDGADFPALLLESAAAGRALRPQMEAWGLLDLLLHKHPDTLAALLSELAALHAEADVYRIQPRWVGDAEVAAARIAAAIEAAGLDTRDVETHVKRVK